LVFCVIIIHLYDQFWGLFWFNCRLVDCCTKSSGGDMGIDVEGEDKLDGVVE